MDVNDPLHEQEIFLLQPCRNFESVKEGSLNVLILRASQNYASDVTCGDVIAALKAR